MMKLILKTQNVDENSTSDINDAENSKPPEKRHCERIGSNYVNHFDSNPDMKQLVSLTLTYFATEPF